LGEKVEISRGWAVATQDIRKHVALQAGKHLNNKFNIPYLVRLDDLHTGNVKTEPPLQELLTI
jgi:hypothetical protein